VWNIINVNLIQCASSYHHLTSYEEITRILASFLKPGGALIVTDMLHLGKFMPSAFEHAVPHKHGLSRSDIQRAFDGASLTMETYEVLPPTEYEFPDMFLAVGEKPSA
jgi:hypothetical protein